jgi:hypothetical protein
MGVVVIKALGGHGGFARQFYFNKSDKPARGLFWVCPRPERPHQRSKRQSALLEATQAGQRVKVILH